MKKIYKVHVSLPNNFAKRKIIGYNSEIVLAGYLEFPADSTQSLRVEIKIPFGTAEQGQIFRKILTEQKKAKTELYELRQRAQALFYSLTGEQIAELQ